MSIIKTHQVRLVTNNAEATLLSRHQGYARFAFNQALADFKEGLDAGEWRGDQTVVKKVDFSNKTSVSLSWKRSLRASQPALSTSVSEKVSAIRDNQRLSLIGIGSQ